MSQSHYIKVQNSKVFIIIIQNQETLMSQIFYQDEDSTYQGLIRQRYEGINFFPIEEQDLNSSPAHSSSAQLMMPYHEKNLELFDLTSRLTERPLRDHLWTEFMVVKEPPNPWMILGMDRPPTEASTAEIGLSSMGSGSESAFGSSSEESGQSKGTRGKKTRRVATNAKQILQMARKNTFQFYISLITQFTANLPLSEIEQELLREVKRFPSIKNFNKLFKAEGALRRHLARFFNRKTLHRLIQGSKVRYYQYKFVYIAVGNLLRAAFLRRELRALAFPSN